jgi:hypothetical protein
MDFDTGKLVNDIISALKGSVGDGWSAISGFAEKQAKMLANQAAMIAQARISGSLKDDDDMFEFFTNQLKDHATNFARSVATLTLLTIEQAWNAVVKVIWGAINGALASVKIAGIPLPTFQIPQG